MSQDNFDLLNEVPEVQTGFPQYGKLTISTKLMLWQERDGKRMLEEANRTDFMRADKGQRAIDMRFVIDLREFKPQLGFDYDRKVRVGALDWQKTLAPSVEAILGKGSMASDKQNATMASLNGKYVKVIDVPEQPTKKQKEDPNAKVYSTVKFLKVYGSREEALHDASEGFAGTAANGASASEPADPNVPSDYSRADWLSMKGDVNTALDAAQAGKTGKAKLDAKKEAIIAQAKELAATPAQVEWLIAQK